jgi:hypothetical protein
MARFPEVDADAKCLLGRDLAKNALIIGLKSGRFQAFQGFLHGHHGRWRWYQQFPGKLK